MLFHTFLLLTCNIWGSLTAVFTNIQGFCNVTSCYKDPSLLCDVTIHQLTKQLPTQWGSKVPSSSGDCRTQQINALCCFEKSLCSYQLTQCNITQDVIFITDMFLHFFLARQCLTLFTDIILLFTSRNLVLNWTRLWTTCLRSHGLIPIGARDFSSLHSIHSGSKTQPSSCSMDTWITFSRGITARGWRWPLTSIQ